MSAEAAATAPAPRAARPEFGVRHGSLASRLALVAGIAAVAILAAAPYWSDPGTMNSLVRLLCLIALAQMWNLLAGYAGRVSIGQQAFIGLGAYTLILFGNNNGVDVFLCVAIAGVVAAVLAVPIAAVTFRLQGGYFAIGTWVAAEVVRLIIVNIDSLGGGTGASLTAVQGIDITFRQNMTLWISLALAAGSIVVVYGLLRSRLGNGLRALRDARPAAQALGVSSRRSELIAFVIAAAGCGIAGAIIYLNLLRVSPSEAFSVNWTAFMIFMVVIGGIGTIEGPIIGALLFYWLQENLSGSTYLILLGLVAILFTIKLPGGIWGWISDRWGISLFPITPRLEVKSTEAEQRRTP